MVWTHKKNLLQRKQRTKFSPSIITFLSSLHLKESVPLCICHLSFALLIVIGRPFVFLSIFFCDYADSLMRVEKVYCISHQICRMLLKGLLSMTNLCLHSGCSIPVSYTHLDVYKRQVQRCRPLLTLAVPCVINVKFFKKNDMSCKMSRFSSLVSLLGPLVPKFAWHYLFPYTVFHI